MSASRTTLWLAVPAGTVPAMCRSCRATIYWIITAAGKRMPVDCAVEGGEVPGPGAPPNAPAIDNGERRNGRGISHFATCPNAALHRQRR